MHRVQVARRLRPEYASIRPSGRNSAFWVYQSVGEVGRERPLRPHSEPAWTASILL